MKRSTNEKLPNRRQMLRRYGTVVGAMAFSGFGCTVQPNQPNASVTPGVVGGGTAIGPAIAYQQTATGDYAAPLLGGSTSVGTAPPFGTSFSQPTAAGNYLVMALAVDKPQSLQPPTTITVPAGWNQVLTATSTGSPPLSTGPLQLNIYTYPDAPAFTNVTGITLSVVSDWALVIVQLAAAPGSTTVVLDAKGIAPSGAPGTAIGTSTALATTNANDELLAFVAYNDIGATMVNYTPGTGFAGGVITDVGAATTGRVRLSVAQTTASTAGIQSVSGSVGGPPGGDWVAAILALFTP